VVTPSSYIAGNTEILVEFIATPSERAEDRRKRQALELEQARKLRKKLLAKWDEMYGDDCPDDVADEIADELGDTDEIEGEF
jgi:hypothetical protein